MSGIFSVQIGHFAERHFIKGFEKKYKALWNVTLVAITAELARIDSLLATDRAEIICDAGNVKIIKTKFKVARSKESAKTSGNRCIVVWDLDVRIVTILLIYGKTDLSGHNETNEWKRLINENYPEYRHMVG